MGAFLKYIEPTTLIHDVTTAVTDSVNWGINESIIKMIKIQTASNDWGLILSCDATLSGGIFDYYNIANHVAGDQNFYLDIPFVDNNSNNSVHLSYFDYNTTDNAIVEVFGQKARIV